MVCLIIHVNYNKNIQKQNKIKKTYIVNKTVLIRSKKKYKDNKM